jgi:hypothetical protein
MIFETRESSSCIVGVYMKRSFVNLLTFDTHAGINDEMSELISPTACLVYISSVGFELGCDHLRF